MNESTGRPGDGPAPVAVMVDGTVEPETAQEKKTGNKSGRRGRIAAAVGCGALLVAVVAGIGFTVVTVNDADRDAGALEWRFPKAAKEDSRPKAASGLAGMLVPYGTGGDPDGYGRGPDIEEFGSDSEFNGRQATELRKRPLRDLPRSQRLRLEKQIDKGRIKDMAMRSYLSPPDTLGYSGKVFTADIVLSRMDKKAVRGTAAFQSEFLSTLGAFREGPKIEGHKNARCFLSPKVADKKLDMMFCSASRGDVLVGVTAYGVKPLNTRGVASLVREQLDRIAEPGEAV
ncbi:hypothetical protein [Streptomyces sp. NPDC001815]|uniref:hypothetical protein n=1 Tax=Streptomyces sp. NPDC001815 TaxID=3154526 RepID=UPI00332978AD